MNARLIKPFSGATNIDNSTEMIVLFDKGRLSLIDIRVDGQYAVKSGKTQDGFTTTHKEKIGDKIKWGVRKTERLPPRDILVQGKSSPDCYTIEERFFVKGASVKVNITKEDKDFSDIPDKLLDICYSKDINQFGNSWRFVGCANNGKTYLLGSDFFREFNFSSDNPKVCEDNVNVELSKNRTGHLPFNYEPTASEDSWYIYDNELENIKFSNKLNVSWTKDKFITTKNLKPITDEHEKMLWTKEDIGAEIEDIKIVTEDTLLINNRLAIRVDYPEVVEV